MANYTATSSVTVYDSLEEAVAGIETKLEATLVTRLNLRYDIIQTRDGKYSAWLVYTAEA